MSQPVSEARLRMWMDRLGPRLIAVSAGICRDRHRAEEIVQEAFVKLWQRPPDAGEPAYPSWLRRVVTNLSINALQRTRRHASLPEHSPDPALRHDRGPDARADAAEQVAEVRAALDQLDDSKRTILVLRAYEQLSYEQIAEHLGIPVGTVMSRLNRARTALAQALEEGRAANQNENVPPVLKFRQRGAGGA